MRRITVSCWSEAGPKWLDLGDLSEEDWEDVVDENACIELPDGRRFRWASGLPNPHPHLEVGADTRFHNVFVNIANDSQAYCLECKGYLDVEEEKS